MRADEPKPDESVRQRRLELLQARVDQFQIEVAGEERKPLKRGQQPISAVEQSGSRFRQRRDHLPVPGGRSSAGHRHRLGPQCRGQPGNRPGLAGVRVAQRQAARLPRDSRELWSPKTGGLVDQPLAGAPPPAEHPAQRLVQMRELARRFQATSYKMDSRNELRLLTQPLYRYQDEAAGILDGPSLSFAEGNDPEAVLLLEALREPGGKDHQWRYTLARCHTYRVSIRLDDREVFTAEPYWRNPAAPATPTWKPRTGSSRWTSLRVHQPRNPLTRSGKRDRYLWHRPAAWATIPPKEPSDDQALYAFVVLALCAVALAQVADQPPPGASGNADNVQYLQHRSEERSERQSRPAGQGHRARLELHRGKSSAPTRCPIRWSMAERPAR